MHLFSIPPRAFSKAPIAALCFSTLLLVSASSNLQAQGAQKYGVQFSALTTAIDAGSGTISGFGVEPQLRLNRIYRSASAGVISLGVGGQWSTHTSGPDDLTITGVFVEPRWVPAVEFERVFPYVSGRIAVLNQSSNFGTSSSGLAYGAGGGIAYVLNSKVNIDAGVAIIRQTFDEFTITRSGANTAAEFQPFTTYAAKLGLSVGFP